MSRTTLPPRRPNLSRDVVFDGRPFTVCVGFDPATGAAREVFVDGASREGSSLQALLDDACIVVSLALQLGATPAQLAHSLCRVPAVHGGRPVDAWASWIGEIVGVLIDESRP